MDHYNKMQRNEGLRTSSLFITGDPNPSVPHKCARKSLLTMNLSYFIQPVHPPNRNYQDILNEDIESVILADKLGFQEAFFGEHFTDLAEPITSSLMFGRPARAGHHEHQAGERGN